MLLNQSHSSLRRIQPEMVEMTYTHTVIRIRIREKYAAGTVYADSQIISKIFSKHLFDFTKENKWKTKYNLCAHVHKLNAKLKLRIDIGQIYSNPIEWQVKF